MTTNCTAQPCPLILSSQCVFYTGETLLYSGIHTNDSLTEVIQQFDTLIHDCHYQITVSDTPPANPYLYQLWYDIG
jgi:hypothetical protein